MRSTSSSTPNNLHPSNGLLPPGKVRPIVLPETPLSVFVVASPRPTTVSQSYL
jgi:hypothetical protein